MYITSIYFLIFSFLSALFYYISPNKIKNVFLLLASYGFFIYFSNYFLCFLVLSTGMTYGCAILIENTEVRYRKFSFIAVLVINILFLAFFKYANFILDSVFGLINIFGASAQPIQLNIIMPVGISFYTFQALGYLIDVYKGKIKAERNIVDYALFVSFFPQIVAGPIERGGNMLPQYKAKRTFKYENMREGLILVLWGYFLKIVLADRLAILVDNVYDNYNSLAGTVLFIASLCYTFEIYFDFAGYSNIAIGLAKIFGFNLMDNFKSPYLSETITEFWRRWHISLSTWFRDYLYIPLGGNRKGTFRKNINVLIVFMVSGLWHVASWTFVFWGLLHGIYQVIENITRGFRDRCSKMLNIHSTSLSHKFFKILVTFFLVNIAWIFFRIDDIGRAFEIIGKFKDVQLSVLLDDTFLGFGLSAGELTLCIIGIILTIFVDICNYREVNVRNIVYEQPLVVRWILYIILFFVVLICGIWGSGYNGTSFIYSNF